MSDEDQPPESLLCVTQQSANKLKFTISLSGSRGPTTDSRGLKESELAEEVTGRNLYLVLCDIHNQLVRRDPRGIFANPVTDEIAVGYSQTISNPMDLGTIYTRLRSRSFYHSASEYLADVTLMCENAMVYNPPDTIYYQRARKLLAYCRKQMTPTSLRKLCENLELADGLKDHELGNIASLTGSFPRHHKLATGHHHRRLSSKDSLVRSSSRITPCSVRLERSWHGAQRSTPSGPPMRFTGSRTASGLDKRSSRKVGRPRHVDRLTFDAASSSVEKHHRMISQELIESEKTEVSTHSPSAESTPLPSKPVPVVSPLVKSKHQPTGRPRGRPRKVPRPPRTPPQFVATESDTSLPNSPPHLSTISSSSPSSASAARRATGSCPSPVSSSTRADSPAARSISCVSDAPSTSVSTGTAPLETSIGATTPSVSFALPIPTVVTPTGPEPSCPTLESATAPVFTTVDESVLTPVVKRGRGRPPKCPRSAATTSSNTSEEITLSPRRTKKRPLVGATAASSVKRRAPTSQPGSPTTPPTTESMDTSAVVVVAKTPVPKSDATTQVEDDVLEQARQAAQMAVARLRSKYARSTGGAQHDNVRIGPRTVYLDCDTPGQVNAMECPWVQSSQQLIPMDLGHNPPDRVASECHPMGPVNYPDVMNQILTGYRSRSSCVPESDLENESSKTRDSNPRQKPYVPLVDPFNAEQLEDLKQLSKLKYNPDEPISAAFHGPLAVFSPEELGQMAEIYGGDMSVMEYAFSLLTFVEPMGRWARRWATKQLDAATDGLHSQFALCSKAPELGSCQDTDKTEPPFPMWMHTAGLTVDSPSPPCSPKTESHAGEFDDESSVPLLHSLGQVDPSAMLSAETSLQIAMDSQTVFSGTTDLVPISNATPFSCVSTVPVPIVVAATAPAVPTSGEQVPASIAYETAVTSVPTPTATLAQSSPILIDSSTKPSLALTASPHNAQIDPTGLPSHSDLVTENATTTDLMKPEGPSLSDCSIVDSPQSEPVTSSGGTSIMRPEVAMETSKSYPRLDDVLTNSTATASNSLLKSALSAAGSLPTLVDRATNLLVHIPVSPNDTLSQKLTSRPESLLQHSPQVTVPSDLLTGSGSRMESSIDVRSEVIDIHTTETEHKATLLTDPEDSADRVRNQGIRDPPMESPSFRSADVVVPQPPSSTASGTETTLSSTCPCDQVSPESTAPTADKPIKLEEAAEAALHLDIGDSPQGVDQTCIVDQSILKVDDPKLESTSDSTPVSQRAESLVSSVEEVPDGDYESVSSTGFKIECDLEEKAVNRELDPRNTIAPSAEPSISEPSHKTTETESVSVQAPHTSKDNHKLLVTDSSNMHSQTVEATIPMETGLLSGETNEPQADGSAPSEVCIDFLGNTIHSVDASHIPAPLELKLPSIIKAETEPSSSCIYDSFKLEASVEVTGNLSHPSEIDIASTQTRSLSSSLAESTEETLYQASVDMFAIHTEETAPLAAVEPCSIQPLITSPVSPARSVRVVNPIIFSSSVDMHLEEIITVVSIEPCSLEPTTVEPVQPIHIALCMHPTILSSVSIVSCHTQSASSPSEFQPSCFDQTSLLLSTTALSRCSSPSLDVSNTCTSVLQDSPIDHLTNILQTSPAHSLQCPPPPNDNNTEAVANSRTQSLFIKLSHANELCVSTNPVAETQQPDKKQMDLTISDTVSSTSPEYEPHIVNPIPSLIDGSNVSPRCCENVSAASDAQESTTLDLVVDEPTEGQISDTYVCPGSSELICTEVTLDDTRTGLTHISSPLAVNENDTNE